MELNKRERVENLNIKKVTAVYFSPTSGTKKYVKAIAKGLCAEYEVIDLTVPQNRKREYVFGGEDLVILGAPVYAGRLPEVEGGIFEGIRGENTPAVFNVSYGNREFEDALLEEKEICEQNGFIGIAAGAWIAPHTYSSRIGAGRPDKADRESLKKFIDGIKEVLKEDIPGPGGLKIPGEHPYRERKRPDYHPLGEENCIGCGTCVSVCPVEAISEAAPRETDASKCINCFACVKNCPLGARQVTSLAHQALVDRLESNLISVRKEPSSFWIERR